MMFLVVRDGKRGLEMLATLELEESTGGVQVIWRTTSMQAKAPPLHFRSERRAAAAATLAGQEFWVQPAVDDVRSA